MWIISLLFLVIISTQSDQECQIPLELQFSIEAELEFCE
jgi:hypothetical protein